MIPTPVSLLQRLQARATDSDWERFVHLYTPLLYYWIRRQGFVREDASELVQDVMLTLIVQLPTFRYDSSRSFSAWLKTVAGNRCRDMRRRLQLRKKRDLPREVASENDEIEELADLEYQRRLAQEALTILQAEFEPNTWRAFWGLAVESRPARELAAELGMTVNAVYVAKSRVLRRLRQEFGEMLE
ncbi:MAG: sigma-70 family RNA polymerase sigma factor [Pirellulales bacterium]